MPHNNMVSRPQPNQRYQQRNTNTAAGRRLQRLRNQKPRSATQRQAERAADEAELWYTRADGSPSQQAQAQKRRPTSRGSRTQYQHQTQHQSQQQQYGQTISQPSKAALEESRYRRSQPGPAHRRHGSPSAARGPPRRAQLQPQAQPQAQPRRQSRPRSRPQSRSRSPAMKTDAKGSASLLERTANLKAALEDIANGVSPTSASVSVRSSISGFGGSVRSSRESLYSRPHSRSSQRGVQHSRDLGATAPASMGAANRKWGAKSPYARKAASPSSPHSTTRGQLQSNGRKVESSRAQHGRQAVTPGSRQWGQTASPRTLERAAKWNSNEYQDPYGSEQTSAAQQPPRYIAPSRPIENGMNSSWDQSNHVRSRSVSPRQAAAQRSPARPRSASHSPKRSHSGQRVFHFNQRVDPRAGYDQFSRRNRYGDYQRPMRSAPYTPPAHQQQQQQRNWGASRPRSAPLGTHQQSVFDYDKVDPASFGYNSEAEDGYGSSIPDSPSAFSYQRGRSRQRSYDQNAHRSHSLPSRRQHHYRGQHRSSTPPPNFRSVHSSMQDYLHQQQHMTDFNGNYLQAPSSTGANGIFSPRSPAAAACSPLASPVSSVRSRSMSPRRRSPGPRGRLRISPPSSANATGIMSPRSPAAAVCSPFASPMSSPHASISPQMSPYGSSPTNGYGYTQQQYATQKSVPGSWNLGASLPSESFAQFSLPPTMQFNGAYSPTSVQHYLNQQGQLFQQAQQQMPNSNEPQPVSLSFAQSDERASPMSTPRKKRRAAIEVNLRSPTQEYGLNAHTVSVQHIGQEQGNNLLAAAQMQANAQARIQAQLSGAAAYSNVRQDSSRLSPSDSRLSETVSFESVQDRSPRMTAQQHQQGVSPFAEFNLASAMPQNLLNRSASPSSRTKRVHAELETSSTAFKSTPVASFARASRPRVRSISRSRSPARIHNTIRKSSPSSKQRSSRRHASRSPRSARRLRNSWAASNQDGDIEDSFTFDDDLDESALQPSERSPRVHNRSRSKTRRGHLHVRGNSSTRSHSRSHSSSRSRRSRSVNRSRDHEYEIDHGHSRSLGRRHRARRRRHRRDDHTEDANEFFSHEDGASFDDASDLTDSEYEQTLRSRQRAASRRTRRRKGRRRRGLQRSNRDRERTRLHHLRHDRNTATGVPAVSGYYSYNFAPPQQQLHQQQQQQQQQQQYWSFGQDAPVPAHVLNAPVTHGQLRQLMQEELVGVLQQQQQPAQPHYEFVDSPPVSPRGSHPEQANFAAPESPRSPRPGRTFMYSKAEVNNYNATSHPVRGTQQPGVTDYVAVHAHDGSRSYVAAPDHRNIYAQEAASPRPGGRLSHARLQELNRPQTPRSLAADAVSICPDTLGSPMLRSNGVHPVRGTQQPGVTEYVAVHAHDGSRSYVAAPDHRNIYAQEAASPRPGGRLSHARLQELDRPQTPRSLAADAVSICPDTPGSPMLRSNGVHPVRGTQQPGVTEYVAVHAHNGSRSYVAAPDHRNIYGLDVPSPRPGRRPSFVRDFEQAPDAVSICPDTPRSPKVRSNGVHPVRGTRRLGVTEYVPVHAQNGTRSYVAAPDHRNIYGLDVPSPRAGRRPSFVRDFEQAPDAVSICPDTPRSPIVRGNGVHPVRGTRRLGVTEYVPVHAQNGTRSYVAAPDHRNIYDEAIDHREPRSPRTAGAYYDHPEYVLDGKHEGKYYTAMSASHPSKRDNEPAYARRRPPQLNFQSSGISSQIASISVSPTNGPVQQQASSVPSDTPAQLQHFLYNIRRSKKSRKTRMMRLQELQQTNAATLQQERTSPAPSISPRGHQPVRIIYS
jgi:hypothetical protein